MSTTSSPHSIKIIQITDPHLFASSQQQLLGVNTTSSFLAVVKHIKATQLNLDMVLATGDISHDGSSKSYNLFFTAIKPLAPIIRSLPGNHDDSHTLRQEWLSYNQSYTDIGNWRIIALDTTIKNSNNGYLDNQQLDLLEQACIAANDRHILIAMHHNPVAMTSQWLDSMMVSNQANFFARIKPYKNIKAVLWGHVHQAYDEFLTLTAQHKIRMLACPATSIQFKPQSQKFALDNIAPGYRVLELKNNGDIYTKVIRVQGTNLQPDLGSTGY